MRDCAPSVNGILCLHGKDAWYLKSLVSQKLGFASRKSQRYFKVLNNLHVDHFCFKLSYYCIKVVVLAWQ